MEGQDESDTRRQLASRIADIDQEDGLTRSPISGLFSSSLPIPSLENALASVAEVLPGFKWDSKNVKIALRHARKIIKSYNFMSIDEICSIVLYTMEENPREESLYYYLNKALRNKDRSAVKLWQGYIWLLMHALKKLPASKTTHVVRGAKSKLADMALELSEGDEFTWSGFSSVATTIDVMKSFLGETGERTMIQIELVELVARDIRDFSFFPSEHELLLPPNMCFEFVSKFNAGGGLMLVQARQAESLDVILDLKEDGKEFIAGSGAKAVATLKVAKPPTGSENEREVRAFLEDAGLSKFADAFIENGWEDMDMLKDMSQDDLKELGLGGGHRKKLSEKLAALDDTKSKANDSKANKAEEKAAAEEREKKIAIAIATEQAAKRMRDQGVETEFLEAAMFAKYAEMRRLADSVNVNCEFQGGKTALGIVCFRGNLDEIKFLLAKGADNVGKKMLLEASDESFVSSGPLVNDMRAVTLVGEKKGRCKSNDKEKVFEFYSSLECSAEARSKKIAIAKEQAPKENMGETEFLESAMSGRYAEMAMLADSVNVNCESHGGDTALGIVCFRGDLEEIKFLLGKGADNVGKEMLRGASDESFVSSGPLVNDMRAVTLLGEKRGRCKAKDKEKAFEFYSSLERSAGERERSKR